MISAINPFQKEVHISNTKQTTLTRYTWKKLSIMLTESNQKEINSNSVSVMWDSRYELEWTFNYWHHGSQQ